MNHISSFGKDLAIHCGGLTARRATVEPIDDFTEHQTASGLVKAAVADIPGDLDRHCPAWMPEPGMGTELSAGHRAPHDQDRYVMIEIALSTAAQCPIFLS
jgi:hypothetical protein